MKKDLHVAVLSRLMGGIDIFVHRNQAFMSTKSSRKLLYYSLAV